MKQTTDDRIIAAGVAGGVEASARALREEIGAFMDRTRPFRDQAMVRMAGEGIVAAQCLVQLLDAARRAHAEALDLDAAMAATSVILLLPRATIAAREACAGLMAMGYALALADLAALPPEE